MDEEELEQSNKININSFFQSVQSVDRVAKSALNSSETSLKSSRSNLDLIKALQSSFASLRDEVQQITRYILVEQDERSKILNQREQEAAELADMELRAQYGQGVDDLSSLFGSFLNFPVAGINMAEGGIANVAPGMPQGMQVDGRNGTFIPMGVKEKADDGPAMLSKNEFVMTADAVRGMGGGNVDVGAQRMYDLMNNLEARV